MPLRLLREGILNSERVDSLDAPAEVFYRRLMSKVDDHGLHDARPAILRASLYPLRVDRVREADITRWIAACEKAGVIALYSHAAKPYLQMLDTRWKARSEPKCPVPPWGLQAPDSSCAQPKTTALLYEDVVVDEDVDTPAAKPSRAKPKTRIPEDFAPNETGTRLCVEAGFTVADELPKFRNHHEAQGTLMSDWQAGFRTWIDKAKSFRKPWQQPVNVTVPSRQGPDPELVRLERDAKAAKPMPDFAREALAAMKGKPLQ